MTLAADAPRAGAWLTIRRGLRLSPELRRGLPGTLVLALIATAGRVIVPIAIQQVIDGGIAEGEVDMAFVARMCLLAAGAVAITAGATGWMHLRLARVAVGLGAAVILAGTMVTESRAARQAAMISPTAPRSSVGGFSMRATTIWPGPAWPIRFAGMRMSWVRRGSSGTTMATPDSINSRPATWL